MRSVLFRASSIAICALALLSACGGQEYQNLKKETGEAWDAAKAWGAAKRADAEKVFASSVDGLAKTYEASKAKAQAVGGDAAKKFETSWSGVQQKLTEMKSATGENWEKARDAFVASYEAFKKEFSPGK